MPSEGNDRRSLLPLILDDRIPPMTPLLLGLTVLFWGWQTGLWIFAIPIALAAEIPLVWPQRWRIEDEIFSNRFNFCFVASLIFAVYLFVNARNLESAYLFMRWQPIFFAPLVLTQLYGDRPGVSPYAFVPFLREDWTPGGVVAPGGALAVGQPPEPIVDLRYLYFALCLGAASAANTSGIGFYLGVVGLVTGVLWPHRSQRVQPWRWVLLMLLAAGLGFGGHRLLDNAHDAFESQVIEWLGDYYRREVDPFRRDTAIGELGKLKQSNAIAFRVAGEDAAQVPTLLQEATYNRYHLNTWLTAAEFTPVEAQGQGQRWVLQPGAGGDTPGKAPLETLTIYGQLTEGQGLLKLPGGAEVVDPLVVKGLEVNPYGTTRIQGKPGGLVYGVAFDPDRQFSAPPMATDLDIPLGDRGAIEAIAQELDLKQQPPAAVPSLLSQYFQQNFSYSLDLKGPPDDRLPLTYFLRESRSGHCEYFATATTLLLRAAGIPARYAIGFSVHEFSPLEQKFIVRTRHAHAWALAYINGTWQTLDTTPGDWIAQENRRAPLWGGLGDGFSFLGFRLNQIWQQLTGGNLRQYWWVLMIPLVIILFRQLDFKKRTQRLNLARTAPELKVDDRPGLDSELYAIEQILQAQGLPRHSWETLGQWIDRLQATDLAAPAPSPTSPAALQALRPILALHYRYRFDPQGLGRDDRDRLRRLSQDWIQQFQPQAIPSQPRDGIPTPTP